MALMGLQFPASRISGRLKNNSNVNSWNNGQQILRAFTMPPNPDTTDQQAVRTAFSLLTKNWKLLTTAQTDAWNAFAVANPITNRLGNLVPRTGLSAYVELGSIHYYRTAALLSAAPTLPRPAPPSSLDLDIAQTGGQNLNFNIVHSLPSVANTWWLVRATEPLESVKVTPALNRYRMIEGVGAGSFIAAAASPDNVAFTPTKYDYADGDYYGVEVQTVNIEGWTSVPIRAQHLYNI
jgi:hypothetical protein